MGKGGEERWTAQIAWRGEGGEGGGQATIMRQHEQTGRETDERGGEGGGGIDMEMESVSEGGSPRFKTEQSLT